MFYRNATDFITFVKLDAPDFAPEDELTCEKAIERIKKYLSDIREIEKNEIALKWLNLCGRNLDVAEKLFNEHHDSSGRKSLDLSRTYLINASDRKSMDAIFIAGNAGGAQDLNSGFPA